MLLQVDGHTVAWYQQSAGARVDFFCAAPWLPALFFLTRVSASVCVCVIWYCGFAKLCLVVTLLLSEVYNETQVCVHGMIVRCAMMKQSAKLAGSIVHMHMCCVLCSEPLYSMQCAVQHMCVCVSCICRHFSP